MTDRFPTSAHVEQDSGCMKKTVSAETLELSWSEIGYLGEGLALASRPFRDATKKVTEQYCLGPRGAWILRLIGGGDVSPSDLTRIFHVGRSLISAELARLVEAGLITYTKNAEDQRRVELALTKLGQKADLRVKADLTKVILQRLSGYTRTDILLCSKMLHDFIGTEQTAWRQNLPRK